MNGTRSFVQIRTAPFSSVLFLLFILVTGRTQGSTSPHMSPSSKSFKSTKATQQPIQVLSTQAAAGSVQVRGNNTQYLLTILIPTIALIVLVIAIIVIVVLMRRMLARLRYNNNNRQYEQVYCLLNLYIF